jgi:L-threonylcarbamoyladenylate synthase
VKTEILAATLGRRSWHRHPADPCGLEARTTTAAVELLRNGDIVALPTETVYGLAADALNPIAVAKIFEAKDRPRFDPLIVHLPDPKWLEKIVDVPAQDRKRLSRLTDRFWPGPLTIVLPKREIVPDIVTAGLGTVAVRISAHPIFSEIAIAFGKPIAAPSANRFGRISPTTARHVLNELGGRIPLIIDGGPTEHGIESTIVAIQNRKIEILRRGPITEEQLRGIGFQMSDRQPPSQECSGAPGDADATTVRAPGQLPSHYAPKTPLRLIDDTKSFSLKKNQHVGLLAWKTSETDRFAAGFEKWRSGDRRSLKFVAIRRLSEKLDLREAAANLFGYLRELDALDLDLIVAEPVPDRGLGRAINDRLRRAAAK